MPRIQQLSPHVINKIAAGEVIERPASVVKELLENSVDALATRIDVDIAEGGIELIRVVDNGEGIHADDFPLAVASHATSKLGTAEDLFRVQTLGFRGEALASIAEVSHVRLRSRPPEASEGREMDVTMGTPGPIRPCGCPAGTLIEVRDLFANTPVRRKFLKTTGTEFGHISEQFTRVALAHPRLHMVLSHNRKPVYELPATEQLQERIALFFGGDVARDLIWVESEVEGTRLWGYVGHPSQSKSTRKGQYLFLNGRWIQDRSLQHALTEAYRGLLMVGRNPVCFLFLEMAADLVDVNVHPTKMEVRFRESQKLYRQLLAALRTKFLGMDLNSDLRVQRPNIGGGLVLQPLGGPVERERREIDPARQMQVQQDLVAWAKEHAPQWNARTTFDNDEELSPTEPGRVGPDSSSTVDAESEGRIIRPSELTSAELAALSSSADPDFDFAAKEGLGQQEASGATPPGPPFQRGGNDSARAMQIHDAYLVVETDEGLTVVDQHALHERIMYEQLRNRVLAGAVESQRLLLPETVELSAAEAALVIEHAQLLAELGLGVESFGGNTLLVTACPVMLSRADPAQILRDISEQLASSGQNPSRRDLLDKLLHMISCKAAIKAGQRLSPEEIDSLLAQRHLIDDAHHCPHGRPTALVLSRAELDRQFGRLG